MDFLEIGLTPNPIGAGDNQPGLANKFLLIEHDYIDTFAALGAVTTAADVNTLSGNHTLVATKYWEEVYATEGTGRYVAEMYGQPDGNGFNISSAEFFRPGTSAENLAFMTEIKNKGVIALVKSVNCADTRYFQIGTECLAARVTSMILDSQLVDGEERAGVTFTISARMGRPLVYTGTVPQSA